MASRRMISVSVMMTDGFYSLSKEAKLIYPFLILVADDYGIVANPKTTCKMQDISLDVLDELESNNYIIRFKSGVCAITHWFIQNKQTRKISSEYHDELSRIKITEQSTYILIEDYEVCESALDYQKKEEAKKREKQQKKQHEDNMHSTCNEHVNCISDESNKCVISDEDIIF